MRYDLKIGAVSWIKADPNPVTVAAEALIWKPDWIPKVVIGLVATANKPPPPEISDFASFRKSQNFRCLSYVHLAFETDGAGQDVKTVVVKEKIQDPGWTPPFNRWKFPTTFLKPDDTMSDPTAYPGEMSSLSKMVVKAKHPNSVIASGPQERVIWNCITKFRAGAHTDKVGVSPQVGSPYHVPWVWQETLLTLRKDGKLCLYGKGSRFPTCSWFLNGKVVAGQSELADKSFPHDGREILSKALNLYPALSTGAPASGPQTSATESQQGPIDGHPQTLAGHALPSIHVF